MDREEQDEAIHEIHCRDLFLLTRAKQQIMWRPVSDDLPEKEVVDQLYGEFAPPDFTACIVLKVGQWTLPVPLGAHEADGWDRVCDAMDNMISALDDEASAQ